MRSPARKNSQARSFAIQKRGSRTWERPLRKQFLSFCGNFAEGTTTSAKYFLNLFYPPVCPHCDCPLDSLESHPVLCQECDDKLRFDQASRCSKCGLELPKSCISCPTCRKQNFRFDAVITLGDYRGVRREAILRMKHFSEQPLGSALGRALADSVKSRLMDKYPDVIAPVPMSWWRRARRGFSGPELLAESIARILGIRMDRRLICCQRSTQKQSLLSPPERQRNVRGAFRLTRGYHLDGCHVMLIDDVVTTGATVNELARILRRAGTRRITVIAVARAS